MSSKVDKLTVRNDLFLGNDKYTIPLYQRAFAWEEKQLVQLVEDIDGIVGKSDYYIGSLIVSRKNKGFEVVDGQQRLTSLYLLMSCLGMELENTLSFDCREKSNYTLSKVRYLLDGKEKQVDFDYIDEGLHRGIKILKEKTEDKEFDREDFLKKLEKVIIYRIEVPQYTDLNQYFEIMNTRGEQLEQHDIVKAMLLSDLPNEERSIFAKIWEACSDMTGYVQMHFGVGFREWIFGNGWQDIPSNRWKDIRTFNVSGFEESDGRCITDIVKKNFYVSADNVVDEGDDRIRFESIIEFPYFLLHVLKVFVRLNSMRSAVSKEELLNESLDDKKLIESFKNVRENGVIRGNTIDKKDFSRRFIVCLLRSRYLFDKYIIKREYTNDVSDGEWSLKEMRVSGQKSKKRPYYINTRFMRSSANKKRNEANVMIQSALRVSYTSPKVMHWITSLLYWLSKNDCADLDNGVLEKFDAVAEGIAVEAVEEEFAYSNDDMLGVNTPHIVFNYLDFLIWKSDSKKYNDFVFEFRNSVEHWYPQNPSEETFERWNDGVNRFGNLCIIQRNINSKFSNLSPEAKKSTFDKMIAKGSLKLRIMSELTEKKRGKSANAYWKEVACKEHEDAMICILKGAISNRKISESRKRFTKLTLK